MCLHVPQLCEALSTDVLAGMLNANEEIWNKLMDGAFILNCPRNSLSYFNLITLTERERKTEDSRVERVNLFISIL